MKRLALTLLVGLAGYAVVKTAGPDIARYLRMREM
jgi:hypothetical protein